MTNLTEDEKNKIRMEESFRNEVKAGFPKKVSFFDKIEGPVKFIQGFAIVIGIGLSLLQYSHNSKQERAEAARNYQKTFHEEQMKVYSEAVQAASMIAVAQPGSKDYEDARQQFLTLFWGRMSMFEDKCVEAEIILFRKFLIKFEQKDDSTYAFLNPCTNKTCYYGHIDQVALKKAALALAHQCRLYTIETWLPKDEQLNYNIEKSECIDLSN